MVIDWYMFIWKTKPVDWYVNREDYKLQIDWYIPTKERMLIDWYRFTKETMHIDLYIFTRETM